MSTVDLHAQLDTTTNKLYDQFILFGDSITQQSGSQDTSFGFAPALQNAYIRRLDVINRGLSGYTTQNAILALPKFMPTTSQAKVRLMAIFFGANDACLPGWPQHVPLEKYHEGLRSIIQHPCVVAHSPKILLITPPPVDEHQLGCKQRTAVNTMRYVEACRSEGFSLGLPVVDLWAAFMKVAGITDGQPLPGSLDGKPSSILRDLLRDGLHFTPLAYRVMYEEVMKVISNQIPELSPEKLPFIFPPWEEAPK